jgi:hypothetical protein
VPECPHRRDDQFGRRAVGGIAGDQAELAERFDELRQISDLR